MQTDDTYQHGLVSLAAWRHQIGVSACTVWRWRKHGWLTVTNINGKLYLSAAAIAKFNERAATGEFAKPPVTPRRQVPALRHAEAL